MLEEEGERLEKNSTWEIHYTYGTAKAKAGDSKGDGMIFNMNRSVSSSTILIKVQNLQIIGSFVIQVV